MNAKQTPLVDILRLHAEDLHSDYGHNKSARLLSQAADEIERLRAELTEARKPDCRSCNWYIDFDVECALEGGESECVNGDCYQRAEPVRLYEIDAAMAGGE